MQRLNKEQNLVLQAFSPPSCPSRTDIPRGTVRTLQPVPCCASKGVCEGSVVNSLQLLFVSPVLRRRASRATSLTAVRKVIIEAGLGGVLRVHAAVTSRAGSARRRLSSVRVRTRETRGAGGLTADAVRTRRAGYRFAVHDSAAARDAVVRICNGRCGFECFSYSHLLPGAQVTHTAQLSKL